MKICPSGKQQNPSRRDLYATLTHCTLPHNKHYRCHIVEFPSLRVVLCQQFLLIKLRNLKALLENPLPSTWHVFQGHSKSEMWVCKSLQNDSRLVAIMLFAQGRHNFISMLGVFCRPTFKVKKDLYGFPQISVFGDHLKL